MEHQHTFTQRVEILKNLFIERLKKEGDRISYDEIKSETGLEIRAGKPNNCYLESYKARVECSKLTSQEPFFVEAVRGKGLQRIRMGQAHVKANVELRRTRKRSLRAIEWTTKGREHSENDEEAIANRSMSLIHTVIVAKTSPDQYREEYTRLSNGVLPARTFVSLRDLLRSTSTREPWVQDNSAEK